MKNFIRKNNKNKVFIKKISKKFMKLKYGLKYKVIFRKFNYILRGRKFFGIKRFFLGVLFFLTLLKKKSFSVYNSFLFKRSFIKRFLVNLRQLGFAKFFFYKTNLLKKKRVLKKKISTIFSLLFFQKCYKSYIFNYRFIKKLWSFSRMYFFRYFTVTFIQRFTLIFFRGFFEKFLQGFRYNFSLLTNNFFDYSNAILADSKSFLLLNPVILNNVVAFL